MERDQVDGVKMDCRWMNWRGLFHHQVATRDGHEAKEEVYSFVVTQDCHQTTEMKRNIFLIWAQLAISCTAANENDLNAF